MKKKYKKAELKVMLLNNCIITTSGNNPTDITDHLGDVTVTDPNT